MIQQYSRLRVADNSGATQLMVIQVMGGSRRRYGRVGDIIIASVKLAHPASARRRARSSAPSWCAARACRRADGSFIRFDDNAAVVLAAAQNPRGTRIFGPVARELRERNFMKIVSLAPEVV